MMVKCPRCGKPFQSEGEKRCPVCKERNREYQAKYREKHKDDPVYRAKRLAAVKKSQQKKKDKDAELKRVFELERRKHLKPVPKDPNDGSEGRARDTFWRKPEVEVKPRHIVVDALPGYEGLTKC